MRFKVMITLTLAAFLVAAGGAPPCLAQTPPAQGQKKMQAQKLTITGKIAKSRQGYIIQGQKPPELFTIHNPKPKVLDPLVKSGKTVTIETQIIMGDNVLIEQIDGKKYPGK